MSAAVKINDPQVETSPIAAISTNARIDYILRFSKQAVLVVDELSANYSRIGSLYLGNLSDDFNAAYVAATSKLNNIQIRCRIIEQLFPDVLFDPEQPLAVSILRLLKEQKQPISIVIDHAQFLSFKIIHELCYLAEVAKKAQQHIDVVMVGSHQTGITINQENKLFVNKLSIVSAESGQLLNLDNKCFKVNKPTIFSRNANKIIFITVLAISMVTAIWLLLQQRDSFTFTTLPDNEKSSLTISETVHVKDKLAATNKQKNIKQDTNDRLINKTEQATNEDIYLALTEAKQDESKVPEQASVHDIFSALSQSELSKSELSQSMALADEATNTQITSQKNVQLATKVTKNTANLKANANLTTHHILDETYYLTADAGYVIQLAGFYNAQEFEALKSEFNNVQYKRYYRLLNNKPFLVITSVIYPDRAQALTAIKTLPESLKKREPWVKQVSTIKLEIKNFTY